MQVRDAAFLHRYNEPVLLVLHEGQPTWAGLYTEKKDTMSVTAFSLNLGHQRHLRLWHASELPSDAHSLIPVPLGGCLVLCQSLILYHSQASIAQLIQRSYGQCMLFKCKLPTKFNIALNKIFWRCSPR